MTEVVKTALFSVAAALIAGMAYVTYPQPPVVIMPESVDQDLFTFDDPSQAASLQIVRYDEELGEIHKFKVAKNSRTDLWVIPSHANYPADAEKQMRTAALSLVGLKVLGVATEKPSEHEMYGVVEPDQQAVGRGVGVLVSFKDEKGADLATLIIGKGVRGQPNQRFVRRPRQDPVYAVEIDPDQLSTDFQDWIESDLLKLNAFDIDQLTMKDYSMVKSGAVAKPVLNSDIIVNRDTTDNSWSLERLVTYSGRQGTEADLLPTEELDSGRLNDVCEALADLQIVDVRRKPSGLGANLRADESFTSDAEDRHDLQTKGFYANPTMTGEFDLLSANGEIHVRMADGYRYLLRFGGVEGTDDETAEGGLNRYLFVTASVDETVSREPELEELPAANDEDAGRTDEDERRLAAERERIEKENQRKMDEWSERKENAYARVNELNSRFADWYYVISEDVYRKTHLTLSDIIKAREGDPEDRFDIRSFRKLESEGLMIPQ